MVKACPLPRMTTIWKLRRTGGLRRLANRAGRVGSGVPLRQPAADGQALLQRLGVRWRAGHRIPVPGRGFVSLFHRAAGPAADPDPATILDEAIRLAAVGETSRVLSYWMKRCGSRPTSLAAGNTAARCGSEVRRAPSPRSRTLPRRFGWRPAIRTSMFSVAMSSACFGRDSFARADLEAAARLAGDRGDREDSGS